jgi:amino-transferase class IV
MLKTPSLIETVRIRDGRAPLWHLHLRRLVASCRTLGIPFPLEFDVPSGGTDRVQRIVVGMKGKQVTEREVGSVEPVRLIGKHTSLILTRPLIEPSSPKRRRKRKALGPTTR